MKPGETLEVAIWMTGRETPEQIEAAEAAIARSFDATCAERNVKIGPVLFEEKRPGEDRVPQVPDHVSGPDVRLLVATAEIVARAPELKRYSFLAELEPDDLQRLRLLTRQAFEQHYPGQTLNDAECDAVIELIGPESAMKTVRAAVDGGHVH